MGHIFCMQCGFKIVYNNAKPNFCSKCGQSTGSISSSKNSEYLPRNNSAAISNNYDEDESEDETSIDYVPSIAKLQVDIENSSANNRFNFGALFGQPNSSPRQTRRKQTVDDFIDERKSS